MNLIAACKKCKLKEQCTEGCGLLKHYLDKSDDTLSSRFEDVKHNTWMGDFHEIPLSAIGQESDLAENDYLAKVDGDEIRAFFADIESDHLPIGVQFFYEHLFKKMTFNDLGEKFDWEPSAVRAAIYQVASNLKDALRYITRKKSYVRKRKNLQLPKSIQYLLAHYLDDLTIEEIAIEFGVTKTAVNQSLTKTKGLIERGQIVLELEESSFIMKRLARPGSTKPREEIEYLRKKIA